MLLSMVLSIRITNFSSLDELKENVPDYIEIHMKKYNNIIYMLIYF